MRARGVFATRATFVDDKKGIIRHVEQGSTAIDPTGAYQVCSILPKDPKPDKDPKE